MDSDSDGCQDLRPLAATGRGLAESYSDHWTRVTDSDATTKLSVPRPVGPDPGTSHGGPRSPGRAEPGPGLGVTPGAGKARLRVVTSRAPSESCQCRHCQSESLCLAHWYCQ